MTPCDTCTRKTKMVLGDGPKPCRYIGIGEAPGKEEDRGGRPFIGPSGMELNENYLPLAGLHRQDVYLTNIRKCRPDNNRTPTAKEAMSCALHHLPLELEQVEPEIVFLLGSTACSMISGIDLDADHGIPRQGILFGWSGWIVPLFHPAAGLHETRMMTPQLEDWEKLEPWLDHKEWVWPIDPVPVISPGVLRHPSNRDYLLVDSESGVHAYFNKYGDTYDSPLMCVDTESHLGEHFSTQASIWPRTAVMVKKSTIYAHHQLLEYIRQWPEVTFHNAPADLPFVEPVQKYRDTMIEAYNLGNLPQGLKALGLRLCGVRMKSYLDVVTGPSRNALMDWISQALAHEMECPEVITKELKTKTKVITKANPREKLLWRVADHMMRNPEYDPWERLQGIEGVPQLGIAHVPEKDLVEYGCQDADIGLRVALELEKRRKEQMELWGVREEDRDQ